MVLASPRICFIDLESSYNKMQGLDFSVKKVAIDLALVMATLNNNLSCCNWPGALLIGTIGFWRITKEHYRAEIGYALHPDFHRKGITQEAMIEVLNYGFEMIRLHSVEANVNPNNEASKKLLEKNKFVQEAYFKENYFSNGQFLDSAIYSLLTPVK